jgi:hypothetical protein
LMLGACSDSGPSRDGNAQGIPASQTPAAPTATPNVSILRWGPQTTKAGLGFAVQKNGNSAMWFEQRGIEDVAAVEVWFDQTPLPGTIVKANELVTVEVPPQLFTKPGTFSLRVKLQLSGQYIEVGTFEVLP